jgi:hypothetical protein
MQTLFGIVVASITAILIGPIILLALLGFFRGFRHLLWSVYILNNVSKEEMDSWHTQTSKPAPSRSPLGAVWLIIFFGAMIWGITSVDF